MIKLIKNIGFNIVCLLGIISLALSSILTIVLTAIGAIKIFMDLGLDPLLGMSMGCFTAGISALGWAFMGRN